MYCGRNHVLTDNISFDDGNPIYFLVTLYKVNSSGRYFITKTGKSFWNVDKFRASDLPGIFPKSKRKPPQIGGYIFCLRHTCVWHITPHEANMMQHAIREFSENQ